MTDKKIKIVDGIKFIYEDTNRADFSCIYYDEYISEDNKKCLQIWNDGSYEIFDLA